MEIIRINQSNRNKYVELYSQIKKQIIYGIMEEGEKLPSVRQLSKDGNISCTTVENAYYQLLAEGYIISKPRSGYYVNTIGHKVDESIQREEVDYNFEEKSYAYDLKSDYISDDIFNLAAYKKCINEVINYENERLFQSPSLFGELKLRQEIVKYISRTRGIVASHNRVIVGAGVAVLLNILIELLEAFNYTTIGFENPGFNRAKSIFYNHSFRVNGINVINKGIDMEALYESESEICYVTPVHQFPLGNVMTIDNRYALLKWADCIDGYIIEDDYNSELRYEGQPIAPLKEIDSNDRVIYLGSFSSVLLPSTRLSYMILPEKFMNVLFDQKDCFSQTASVLEQLTVALMIEKGLMDKHIRKLRKYYSKKRDLIIDELKKYLENQIEIGSNNSGYYLLINLLIPIEIEALVKQCRKEDLLIGCIKEYEIEKSHKKNALLINYRGISYDDIPRVISYLAKIIQSF